jgi:ubiquinone/menaquinone biosynthesis C-methylase UbiE
MDEPQWEKTARTTQMGQYLTGVERKFILSQVQFQDRLVLDAGAGGGKYTRLAWQEGAQVISTDIDKKSLLWLKNRTPNANPILADARALPFHAAAFDCALALEVLDYMPETKQAVSELRAVLKQEGRLVCSFGNKNSLKSLGKRLMGSRVMQDQRTYLEMRTILAECSFSLLKHRGYSWIPFKRESNSTAVPVLGGAVDTLMQRFSVASPWVLACVQAK